MICFVSNSVSIDNVILTHATLKLSDRSEAIKRMTKIKLKSRKTSLKIFKFLKHPHFITLAPSQIAFYF